MTVTARPASDGDGDFVHSLDIAGRYPAIDRTECFLQSPFPCQEKGFVASLLVSEGFSLWEIPWGESCSYISFSSILPQLRQPRLCWPRLFFWTFKGKLGIICSV